MVDKREVGAESKSLTKLISQEGNVLSFTEATVYAPLILIIILYLPTMIYIVFISIRFYGLQNWINQIIYDPVYFLFPILTSLSFYEKTKLKDREYQGKDRKLLVHQNVSPNNSQKVETSEQNGNIDNDEISGVHIQSSENSILTITNEDGIVRVESTVTKINEMTVEVGNLRNDALPSEETEKKFSVKQSNTLYLLFCVSTSLCIWGDLWHQSKRGIKMDLCRAPGRLKCLKFLLGSHMSPFTSAAILMFGANFILWVDFMMSNRDMDSDSSNGESFFQDLMRYTTHAAFCVLFLPFLGVYKLVSR